MGRPSRDKGARGEREVVGVLRSHGLACWRTPNSGGLHEAGDVLGVEGWHFEVKRQNVLRIPEWLRQAHEGAASVGGDTKPVLCFRTDYQGPGDPASHWQAIVPLDVLCDLIVKARPLYPSA